MCSCTPQSRSQQHSQQQNYIRPGFLGPSPSADLPTAPHAASAARATTSSRQGCATRRRRRPACTRAAAAQHSTTPRSRRPPLALAGDVGHASPRLARTHAQRVMVKQQQKRLQYKAREQRECASATSSTATRGSLARWPRVSTTVAGTALKLTRDAEKKHAHTSTTSLIQWWRPGRPA